MKKSLNSKGLSYFYIITVFTLTFYGVWFWPIPMLHYIGMVVGFVLPFFLLSSFFSSRQFLLLISYVILVYINYISGDFFFNAPKKVIEEFAALFIPITIFYYYVKSKDFSWLISILMITIVAIVWHSIATAIIDMSFPGIVRYAQGQLQMGMEDVSSFAGFYRVGMSNYMLPHALPILVPAFTIVLRDGTITRQKKLLSLLALIAIMALIYYGGASGPMIVAIIILLLSLIVKPGKIKSSVVAIIVVGLIAIPILLEDTISLSLLKWIDGLMGGEGYFHSKIVLFEESIQYGTATGDIEERQDLYSQGFDSFFSNVLVGSNCEIGGHSALLNRLATLGLIGFIPYFVLLYYQIRTTIHHIPMYYRIYYMLGLFAAILMLATKAIAGWETFFFLFVVLPFAIIYFSNSNKSVRWIR